MEVIYGTIDEESARLAKESYSFYAYEDGSATRKYVAMVDDAKEEAERAAERCPDREGEIGELLDRYARKLAEWCNRKHAIDRMCPSVMICGPANFPEKKKERQNRAMDNHMKSYKAIEELRDRISRVGTGSECIKASEADAADKLRAKIEALEENQEHMKAVNAYYRKHKTLKGCEILREGERDEIKRCMLAVSWVDAPYPPFTLSNNRQRIAATKDRLATIERTKAQGTESRTVMIEGEEVTIVENAEAMRLQLLFRGKPSERVSGVLKSRAFKWAPSASAWQRQLTSNAKYALRQVLEELED